MDTQVEKVYVAVGNDLQDGWLTLDWTLKKWSSQPISIVILHVTYNSSKDQIHLPLFGKVPASAVRGEILEDFRMKEQKQTDELLSEYIAFCGKVKAEILKVEKHDDPIHKLMIDLISGLQITKLVMAITFMRSSSWRSKGKFNGSFEIHQHKPDFCEFYIICEGKLLFFKGENDERDMKTSPTEPNMPEHADCNMKTRNMSSSTIKGDHQYMKFNERDSKRMIANREAVKRSRLNKLEYMELRKFRSWNRESSFPKEELPRITVPTTRWNHVPGEDGTISANTTKAVTRATVTPNQPSMERDSTCELFEEQRTTDLLSFREREDDGSEF